MIGKALLAVVLLGVFIENEASCPAIFPTRENVDIKGYMGTWYMIKAGPKHVGDQTSECFEEAYTQDPNYRNVVDYTYKRRRAGQWDSGNALGIIKDLSHSGVLDIYGPGGSQHQSLIATDYTNWAIWYLCEEFNGVTEHVYMLLGRGRTMSPSTEQILTKFIEGYGLDADNMMHINQTNCAN